MNSGLLPEDKLVEVEKLMAETDNKVAFIGDRINDAPVLAESDVGIAMGGLGRDVAIETADVITLNRSAEQDCKSYQNRTFHAPHCLAEYWLGIWSKSGGFDFGCRWSGNNVGSCFC